MNTVAFIIAIGTFAGLAFVPMFFTSPGHKFRRINQVGAWTLSILVIPCIYFEMGYGLVITGWIVCCLLADLSRFDLSRREIHEDEPIHMEFADMPRISAAERIQNLERLARMRASGLISPEEFDLEKKNFLG